MMAIHGFLCIFFLIGPNRRCVLTLRDSLLKLQKAFFIKIHHRDRPFGLPSPRQPIHISAMFRIPSVDMRGNFQRPIKPQNNMSLGCGKKPSRSQGECSYSTQAVPKVGIKPGFPALWCNGHCDHINVAEIYSINCLEVFLLPLFKCCFDL